MNRRAPLVVLLALAAVYGAVCLLFPGDKPPGPSPGALPVADPAASALEQGDLSPGAAGADLARVATKPPPALPATGDLQVWVSWAIDDAPAVAVPVFVRPKGNPLRVARGWRSVTGGDGAVRFEGLAPGEYVVGTGRGTDGSKAEATLTAGSIAEVRLVLNPGVTVTGVVVDEQQRPVAAASLVVTAGGWGEIHVLGTADAMGRFELRGLSTSCSVGARAEGYGPSLFQGVQGVDGGTEEIRITLRGRGGHLLCRVLDPQGMPIADVVVRLGDRMGDYRPLRLADGTWAFDRPWQEHTDALGEAHFRGFRTGAVSVQTWCAGFGSWSGQVHVLPAVTKVLVIRLQEQVILVGTVRDSWGKPLPDLMVSVGNRELGQRARTDAEGRYRLAGLPPGEIRPQIAGDGIEATTTLTGAPGQTLTWDPVIETDRTVPGRVLGPDGGPFRCMVEGYTLGHRGWLFGEYTDEQGRFTLRNVALDRSLHLTVRTMMFPLVTFEGVPPVEGELVIHVTAEDLPSVRLVGRVVDPQGGPVADATLLVQRRHHGGSPILKTEQDGSFDLGPYSPAEYRIKVAAKGWAKLRTPWRRAQPHETVDLGDVRLEAAGTLIVRVASPVPLEERTQFSILDTVGVYLDRFSVAGGEGMLGGLSSGSYLLQVQGKGIASDLLPFRILTGQVTRLEITAQAGVPVTVVVDAEQGQPRPRRLLLRIIAGDGSEVVGTTANLRESGAVYGDWALVPGRYRVRIQADERSGEQEFEVVAGAPPVAVNVTIH